MAAETTLAALGKNDYSLASLSSYATAVRVRYQLRYDGMLT